MRSNYRSYTSKELEYIRTHCDDPPIAVAKALNAPYHTVYSYIRQYRSETSKKPHEHPPQKYYAMYLRKTDELVCSGSAEECAEQLGITIGTFYTRVHAAIYGKCKKWDVHVEPYFTNY